MIWEKFYVETQGGQVTPVAPSWGRPWLSVWSEVQTCICLIPLPLTVCCFSKNQIGFTFLLLAHPGSPGQMAVKRAYATGVGYVLSLNERRAEAV